MGYARNSEDATPRSHLLFERGEVRARVKGGNEKGVGGRVSSAGGRASSGWNSTRSHYELNRVNFTLSSAIPSTVVVEDGIRVSAGAVCHTNTSSWNPNHGSMFAMMMLEINSGIHHPLSLKGLTIEARKS
ncbi:hypothetical protein EJ110_NYTH29525 [Nymphaea thermarum]|nr:hypothetical protein EJ110_NYTH29525 [Nymphaea thermarum]